MARVNSRQILGPDTTVIRDAVARYADNWETHDADPRTNIHSRLRKLLFPIAADTLSRDISITIFAIVIVPRTE